MHHFMNLKLVHSGGYGRHFLEDGGNSPQGFCRDSISVLLIASNQKISPHLKLPLQKSVWLMWQLLTPIPCHHTHRYRGRGLHLHMVAILHDWREGAVKACAYNELAVTPRVHLHLQLLVEFT